MAKAIQRWPPPELLQIEGALAQLKADLETANRADDDAYVRWLVQLLVIKSSGYVEQAALLSARAHISTLAHGTVRRFGLARVERYFGPKPDELLRFVGRFDSGWANELTDLLDQNDEELRRQMVALLAARDQIAHGRSHNVGVVAALQYCSAATTVSTWFQLRLNPL